MSRRIKAIISGIVQLVMYRDFARRNAKKLGIVGTVRNLPNGSVEVIAEGEEQSLKNYLEMLKKGPLLARVENIEVEWADAGGTFSDFLILY